MHSFVAPLNIYVSVNSSASVSSTVGIGKTWHGSFYGDYFGCLTVATRLVDYAPLCSNFSFYKALGGGFLGTMSAWSYDFASLHDGISGTSLLVALP